MGTNWTDIAGGTVFSEGKVCLTVSPIVFEGQP